VHPISEDARVIDSIKGRHFSIHSVGVELSGELDLLAAEIDRWLGRFATEVTASSQASGTVRRYDSTEVARHLSSTAVRLMPPRGQRTIGPLLDVYHEGEHFWLVDDRWGMVQINLFKSTWRSWLLPQPRLDATACTEMAVLWPMAQVLRGRGMWMLPSAAAVARQDHAGILLFGSIEAELPALAAAGYRVLGTRWSCLREDARQFTLLPMAQAAAPARCDAVIIVRPGRRATVEARLLSGQSPIDALCRAWPMPELHRSRRQFPLRLAHACRCLEAQMSRQPGDFVALLDSLAPPPPPKPQRVIARPVMAMGTRSFVRPGVRRYVSATG
jgi:hypothetical protein